MGDRNAMAEDGLMNVVIWQWLRRSSNQLRIAIQDYVTFDSVPRSLNCSLVYSSVGFNDLHYSLQLPHSNAMRNEDTEKKKQSEIMSE